MDLPSTQQTATILNEEIRKYQELYSEYLAHAVELHNYHQRMIRKPIKTLGPVVRNHIKKMIVLEKLMFKANASLCKARDADYKAKQRERGVRWKTLAEKGQYMDWENGRVIRNIEK